LKSGQLATALDLAEFFPDGRIGFENIIARIVDG
jgi:hypothetical protein